MKKWNESKQNYQVQQAIQKTRTEHARADLQAMFNVTPVPQANPGKISNRGW